MITMNRRTKIFISKEPADMRASYDSLFSKVKTILEEDPMSGHLFVFINQKRTCCKCLYYDGTGLVIWYLCRYRHNDTYADLWIMPSLFRRSVDLYRKLSA
jgi:transposase